MSNTMKKSGQKTLPELQQSIGCEFFVVEKDDSSEFTELLKWLNNIDATDIPWAGNGLRYYGYDGNEENNGTNGGKSLGEFENNPKLFTAAEIMKHINNQMSTEEQIKQLEEQLQKLRKKQSEEQYLPLIKDGNKVNCYKGGVDYAQRLYTKLGDIKFEHDQHIFISRDSDYKGVLEEDNYGNQIFYITKK